jgi:phosphoglycerol transferase MdoB-like AlkP superfamily enzyme
MLKSREMEKDMSLGQNVLQAVREAVVYSVILIASMLSVEVYALVRDAQLYGEPKAFLRVIGSGVLNDLSFGLNLAIVPAGIFILLYLFNKPISRLFFIIFSVFLVAVHVLLVEYYLQTLVPLGAELLGYSLSDIARTIGAAGVPVDFIISATLMLALVIALMIVVPKRLKFGKRLSVALLGLYAIAPILSLASKTSGWKPGPETNNDISLNKSYYFYTSCYRYREDAHGKDNLPAGRLLLATTPSFDYIDEAHFPFLHKVDPDADVLSPFFNKLGAAPNIVFIVVEGLGGAFSNADAYLGSFTPFLDSLSKKSLYWRNFLSAGGRTFAMPPSIFGSLPFGGSGFLDLGDRMPAHLSLFGVLKRNGYSSNFFYGGDAGFDNMNKFMEMNGATVFDEKSFSAGYARMPESNSGFCWGFGDGEVFRRYLEATADSKSPSCNVVLTLSTHSPFLIEEQETYLELFEERMQALGFSDAEKEEHRHYKNQYATILYADNAIRQFFSDYSHRSDFSNTIFIITGDHRMPEIPMSTKIDRYHVPLIIYSPLLKRGQTFGAVSSHFDLTPSLLSFLRHRYNFKVPSVAIWMGGELDTAHDFRSIHAYPLIQTKNGVSDYLMEGYLLNDDDLFTLNDKMDLEPVKDEGEKDKVKAALARFKQKNSTVVAGARLLPDSLLTRYLYR